MKTVYNAVQLRLFPTKTCNICHIEKSLEEFNRDVSKKDGRRNICKNCEYTRRQPYAEAHRIETRLRAKKWAMEHPEEKRAYDKAYRPKKNAKSRERYATDSDYREKLRKSVKEGHAARPDLRNARMSRYRATHRAQFTQYTMSRYARIKAVTVENVNYQHILEQSDGICYICENVILPHHKIEFDHVIPITRGGIHAESNIRVTHKCCNSRKNAKLLEEMTPFQRRGPDD